MSVLRSVRVIVGPVLVEDYDRRGLTRSPYDRITRPGLHVLTFEDVEELLADARDQLDALDPRWTGEDPATARRLRAAYARLIAALTQKGV